MYKNFFLFLHFNSSFILDISFKHFLFKVIHFKDV